MYSFRNLELVHFSMSSSNLLLDLHTYFSRGRYGGLVVLSLEEFSTICCDPTVKGFRVLNKAEVDDFLELSCFFYDPTDVGNLISGYSAFSKSSLNIWKFSVHILLKPSMENFEHYFDRVWDECNCAVVWTFFGIAILWGCLLLGRKAMTKLDNILKSKTVLCWKRSI